jgi:hypothetical protein
VLKERHYGTYIDASITYLSNSMYLVPTTTCLRCVCGIVLTVAASIRTEGAEYDMSGIMGPTVYDYIRTGIVAAIWSM